MEKDVPKKYGVKYFMCFCKVAVSLSAAILCYNVVNYKVVRVLVTYFTDAFGQDAIQKSAVLVNVLGGLQVAVIAGARAYPTSFGFRKIIILSTAVYILGLLMLYLSASNRFPKTNFALYIFVCVLIAVGKAGGLTILKRYLLDQLVAGHENIEDINQERALCRRNVWLVLAGAPVLIIPFRGSWLTKVSNSLCLIGAAGFISLAISCFSHRRHPSSTKTETTIKDRETLPPPDQLSKKRGNRKEAQQRKKSPTCAVKQVNVADRLQRMIPMWSTFIVFSLVMSTADTFFNLQDDSMEPDVTTSNFLLAKDAVKVVANLLCRRFLASTRLSRSEQNFLLKLVICLGTILSVICPSLASQVEVQRLKKAHETGLLGKSEDEKVPMSDWCMAPLFGLWGLMEGFSMRGLDEFFNYHVSKSMEYQGSEIYNKIPIAIGHILGAVCVSISACIGWFGDTLNQSRLDNYYLMITVLAWINLCWFFFITTFYPTKDEEADEDVALQESEAEVIIVEVVL